jgi:hypothetical protein
MATVLPGLDIVGEVAGDLPVALATVLHGLVIVGEVAGDLPVALATTKAPRAMAPRPRVALLVAKGGGSESGACLLSHGIRKGLWPSSGGRWR